jgi:formylglycine-generating enzyme required for sulfatase activity
MMKIFLILLTFLVIPADSVFADEKDMALIKAGEYTRRVFGKEAMPKRVYINEYFIDIFPISIGEYFSCVQSGKCNEDPLQRIYQKSRGKNETASGYDNFFNAERNEYPMTWVSLDDAQTYCRSQGKRLPTESEWEKAARGDKEPEPYWAVNETPWGRGPSFPGDKSREYYSHVRKARDTSLSPGPFGVYNMQGQIQEWTLDYFLWIFQRDFPTSNPLCTKAIFDAHPEETKAYYKNMKEKPPYPRSVKGGCSSAELLATISGVGIRYSGNRGYSDVGFRCVKSELHAPEDFNK